jgi:hypothetical protein
MDGWWHDALRQRSSDALIIAKSGRSKSAARAERNLSSKKLAKSIPLVEWVNAVREIRLTDPTDPRGGEWTALEIVRQIAATISPAAIFNYEYVLNPQLSNPQCRFLHPANFGVPRAWLQNLPPTWDQWKVLVRSPRDAPSITTVPQDQRIFDYRYTPVSDVENVLFESVNPIRGLGLLLFGLLKSDFTLPAVWNGPGHPDVLTQLPRLLLQELSCSSWTLGVLQACLQQRALENILLAATNRWDDFIDNDALHDPIRLLTPIQAANAISVCQRVLERNQLSTLNHRARQLTPVSVRQLTQPDWSKTFEQPEDK